MHDCTEKGYNTFHLRCGGTSTPAGNGVGGVLVPRVFGAVGVALHLVPKVMYRCGVPGAYLASVFSMY